MTLKKKKDYLIFRRRQANQDTDFMLLKQLTQTFLKLQFCEIESLLVFYYMFRTTEDVKSIFQNLRFSNVWSMKL